MLTDTNEKAVLGSESEGGGVGRQLAHEGGWFRGCLVRCGV